MNDIHQKEINEVLCTAAPEVRPEVRGRVLDEMLAARPRRPRRAVVWVVAIVAAAPLLLGAAVAAGVLPWPIGGTLYYRSAEQFGPGWSVNSFFHALTGQSRLEAQMPSSDADPSPVSDEIVWADGLAPDPRPTYRSILIREPDGTDINLTERAGIGALNCKPKWSPDGTMIAFQHCEATGDRPPCKDGFHVWVMNADGSDARPVMPEDAPPTAAAMWFPDSRRLAAQAEGSEAMFSIDIFTGDMKALPAVQSDPVWSPDGNWMASTAQARGELDGKSGVWRQLVLTDAEGDNPRVLVQQFLVDEEIAKRYPTPEQRADPEMDWISDLRYHVGPTTPQWSPEGDKIAFLAALPFDAEGPYYREQVEVWIYDLNTEQLTQVTHDTAGQYSLVWRKPRH